MMIMNAALAPVLQQLRAGLEAQYGDRLDRVLLYGSQARGDAGPESDVDVLVVLAGEVDPVAEIAQTEYLVAALSLEHDLVLSCVFLSLEEYYDEADLFLRYVRHDAIPV
jgi:predicted nucleotidyltransferase